MTRKLHTSRRDRLERARRRHSQRVRERLEAAKNGEIINLSALMADHEALVLEEWEIETESARAAEVF